jgi:repressor LexA
MERSTTLGARLRQLMEEMEMNYERFGALLDMRPQTLNRYVLGQREPKASAVTDMALKLGVDPLWLQGFDVPREPRSAPEDQVLTVGTEVAIPILGVIRAGVPTLAQQEIEGYAAADVVRPEEYFYLRVAGDSMKNAGIQEGDLVLLHQQSCAENGQIVACILGREDATLKRFRRQGDLVILQPENPAYEPRIVSESEFETGEARIVGVAVKLVREL